MFEDNRKEKGRRSMYCSKCGKENPEDSGFCSGCGTPLKTKRDNKKIILSVVCICLIVAIVVACVVKNKKSSEPEESGQKETVTEIATEITTKMATEEPETIAEDAVATETTEVQEQEKEPSKFKRKVYTFSYEEDEEGVVIELDYKSAHSGYATLTEISYYDGKRMEVPEYGSFVEDSDGYGQIIYNDSEELDYWVDYEAEPAVMKLDYYGVNLIMLAQEEQ
jgi:predicted nucleic acid-binding Zn ribbon protein